ncbi:hypothetical protein [Maize yellow striate virus]|uniref:Uncharacterized protein n=1 Tax=Maize yellow striate virus TaxID=1168550 RepID=A0A2D1GTQ6_9RHAB|nr:hypothetical protein KM621_gp09 [Maize yellow striate virus]ATN96442.1 hypothetical protein [Maize yellow striate virus]ATN96452.1 hypothetical protein [Maize yellow striate virus]
MVQLEFELWEVSLGLHLFIIVSFLVWKFKWHLLKKLTQDEGRERIYYQTHK